MQRGLVGGHACDALPCQLEFPPNVGINERTIGCCAEPVFLTRCACLTPSFLRVVPVSDLSCREISTTVQIWMCMNVHD